MQRRKFRIGDLAKRLKVDKFVIRFWEKEFNLNTGRSEGGQRFYEEKDYETFIWIRDNIDGYRDEYHTYDRAAVDPFKASPFSAITRLYIATSSMHPMISYDLYTKMEQFLNKNCTNISFLEQNQLSIIYGPCNNTNLMEIYENVYLYEGTPPTANFTFFPTNPTINDTIYFNSTSKTQFGIIIKYNWDFSRTNGGPRSCDKF